MKIVIDTKTHRLRKIDNKGIDLSSEWVKELDKELQNIMMRITVCERYQLEWIETPKWFKGKE